MVKVMHDESKVGKFIVFKIKDYFLALPIGDVLKVVNCPPISSSGLRPMGVVQLGRHMIRVLNLPEQLSGGGLSELPNNQSFLVITRDQDAELWGIVVNEPPNLLELPLEMMQSLPKSNRHSKLLLDIVSHAAVVSQDEVKTTVFLLDVTQLSNTAINDSRPLSLKPSGVM
jgi:chemotaxis signal transduction protein